MNRWFSNFAQWAAKQAGKAYTFALATASMVFWLALGPHYNWSDTYQLVCNSATTVVTFLMVFLLQNSQSRDTAAIHVKLDELIRATNEARNFIVAAETLTESEIDELKNQVISDSKPGKARRYVRLDGDISNVTIETEE